MLQILRSEASTSTGRALDLKFPFRFFMNLPHITSRPHPERPLMARGKAFTYTIDFDPPSMYETVSELAMYLFKSIKLSMQDKTI